MRNLENLWGYEESQLRVNMRDAEYLKRLEDSCASWARFRFGAGVSLTKLLQIGAEGLLWKRLTHLILISNSEPPR